MKNILMVVSFLFLAACANNEGGGGGSSESSTQAKGLFSYWQSVDGDLDLRDQEFGNQSVAWFILSDTMGCRCDVTITGSESSGSAVVTGCTSVGSAECQGYVNNYTYSKTATTLRVCNPGNQCSDYR